MSTTPMAFKEWALICNALEDGSQSVIFRKGGIAEGRDGFRFRHEAFYLFPTFFHTQKEKTTFPESVPLPEADPDWITLRLHARVEWTALLTDWEAITRLEPFHFWTAATLAERFTYDEPPGIHLAVVRVYRLETPWRFPNAPKYGGCRSWVAVPEPPEPVRVTPVLDDAAHAARVEAIRQAAGLPA